MTENYRIKVFFASALALWSLLFPAAVAAQSDAVALELEGSNWQLVKMTVIGGHVFEPEQPEKYFLNFRSENRLTGQSDCNYLSGMWQHEGEKLSFTPILSSRNLCLSGSLHNYLWLYLQDVVAISLRGEHLVLTTTTDGVELEFEAR